MHEDDIYDVARLHLESWKTAYRHILPEEMVCRLSLREFIATWKTILRDAGRVNWVYDDRNGIQGYVSCRHESEYGWKRGEIIGIYVAPESWGRGIGKRLMGHALKWMSAQQCDVADLWTIVENRRARKFYESIGFKCTHAIRTADKYGYVIRETQYIRVFSSTL